MRTCATFALSWTADALSMEDEVNTAVKLRRPDADDLVATMAAKHANAQEALRNVPNPPSNMVPTNKTTNADSKSNTATSTNQGINSSGGGGSGSNSSNSGSSSSIFNTLGDRQWRRTGALHLIMNCSAGTSEGASEALAEV